MVCDSKVKIITMDSSHEKSVAKIISFDQIYINFVSLLTCNFSTLKIIWVSTGMLMSHLSATHLICTHLAHLHLSNLVWITNGDQVTPNIWFVPSVYVVKNHNLCLKYSEILNPGYCTFKIIIGQIVVNWVYLMFKIGQNNKPASVVWKLKLQHNLFCLSNFVSTQNKFQILSLHTAEMSCYRRDFILNARSHNCWCFLCGYVHWPSTTYQMKPPLFWLFSTIRIRNSWTL